MGNIGWSIPQRIGVVSIKFKLTETKDWGGEYMKEKHKEMGEQPIGQLLLK